MHHTQSLLGVWSIESDTTTHVGSMCLPINSRRHLGTGEIWSINKVMAGITHNLLFSWHRGSTCQHRLVSPWHTNTPSSSLGEDQTSYRWLMRPQLNQIFTPNLGLFTSEWQSSRNSRESMDFSQCNRRQCTHTHRSQCYQFHVRKILLLFICRPFRNTLGGSSEVKGWAEVVGVCLERQSLPSAIITIPLINRAGLSYLPAY